MMKKNNGQPHDTLRFVDIGNNHTLLRYFQKIELQHQNFQFELPLLLDVGKGKTRKTGYLRELFEMPYLLNKSREEGVANENQQTHIADAIKNESIISISGESGTGKTFLLKWLSLTFTYFGWNLTKIASGGARVPFPITLSDLSIDTLHHWDDLWQAFLTENKDYLTTALIVDTNTIDQVFASGQGLFLIDGLDRLSCDDQNKIGSLLQEGMTRYPLCKMVVVGRPQSIERLQQSGLNSSLFQIVPLNKTQTHQMIRKWFNAHTLDDHNNERRIKDVLNLATHTSWIDRLGNTTKIIPLLCAMHLHYNFRPNNEMQLYHGITDIYFDKLAKARLKLAPPGEIIGHQTMHNLMERVALHFKEKGPLSRQAFEHVLKDELHGLGFSLAQTKQETHFLVTQLTENDDWLINFNELDQNYHFSNEDLLNYFSAAALKIDYLVDPDSFKRRHPTINEPRWKETWGMFFEQLDNKKLAEQVIDSLFFQADDSRDQLELFRSVITNPQVRLSHAYRENKMNLMNNELLSEIDKSLLIDDENRCEPFHPFD